MHLGNRNGVTKVWLFVAVELVTRKVFLIPLKNQNTTCLLQSLEILESRRGCVTTIVMDRHASHLALQRNKREQLAELEVELQCLSPTFRKMLQNGEGILLRKRGVRLIISQGERHETIGLCEQTIWNIKHLLLNLWPTKPNFVDMFDLLHKLSLVEQFLNSRPTFTFGRNYF